MYFFKTPQHFTEWSGGLQILSIHHILKWQTNCLGLWSKPGFGLSFSWISCYVFKVFYLYMIYIIRYFILIFFHNFTSRTSFSIQTEASCVIPDILQILDEILDSGERILIFLWILKLLILCVMSDEPSGHPIKIVTKKSDNV